MADIYIWPGATYNGDGSAGNEAASGGAAGAFNTFVGITPASDNNYWIKAGTSFNFRAGVTVSRFYMDGLSNVVIGAYDYVGGEVVYVTDDTVDDYTLPVLTSYYELADTDFSQVENADASQDIWVYDIGTQYSDITYLLGLGSLTPESMENALEIPVNDTNTGYDLAGTYAGFETYGEWGSEVGAADINTLNITVGSPTYIELASATGYAADDLSIVCLEDISHDSGTGPDINGYHEATWVNSTTFSIAIDTSVGGNAYSGGKLDRGAKLYIASDVNPVTKFGTIYYGKNQHKPFMTINGSTNLTIKYMDMRHASAGVHLNTGSDGVEVKYCNFYNVYYGIFNGTSSTFSGVNLHHNTLTYIGSVGIYVHRYLETTEFHHNYFDHCGVTNSYGCIYFGDLYSTSGVRCYLNEAHGGYGSTKVYPNEEFGFYDDSDSENIIWTGNYAEGFYKSRYTDEGSAYAGSGFHSNSGNAGQKFVGNLAVDCYYGVHLTSGLTDTYWEILCAHNTVINCGTGIYASKGQTADGDTTIKNNIIATYSNTRFTGSLGINVHTNSEAYVTEDYNLIYNFGTNARTTSGSPASLSANCITDDPLLDPNYYPEVNSPAYHIGTFLGYWYKDIKGHRYHISPTLGCREFTSGMPVMIPRKDASTDSRALYTTTFTITIANSGSEYGYTKDDYGSIDDDKFAMRIIQTFMGVSSGNAITLTFVFSARFPQISSFTLSWSGGDDVTLTWNGTSYVGADATLYSYLEGNTGTDLELTLTEAG